MIKINFKQPKYIFPLVIFVPLCALVYFVCRLSPVVRRLPER